MDVWTKLNGNPSKVWSFFYYQKDICHTHKGKRHKKKAIQDSSFGNVNKILYQSICFALRCFYRVSEKTNLLKQWCSMKSQEKLKQTYIHMHRIAQY